MEMEKFCFVEMEIYYGIPKKATTDDGKTWRWRTFEYIRCRTLLKFPLYNWILLIGKSIRFMSLSICQFVAIAYDSSVSKSLIVLLNDLFYRRGGEGKKERSNLSEAIIHSANRFGLLLLERNILINLNAKFLYSLITAWYYSFIGKYLYIYICDHSPATI